MARQSWLKFFNGTRGVVLAALLVISSPTFLLQCLSCRLKHSATGLDVVFLLNTQSMGPYYNYSRVLINNFIHEVGLKVTQRFADTQFGLATYGDERDIKKQQCYNRVASLAHVNTHSLRRMTASVVIQGKGISPEDSIGAIIRSLHDPAMGWGDVDAPSYAKRKRVVVLSTDDTAYWTDYTTSYHTVSLDDLIKTCPLTPPSNVDLRGALLQRDASLIVLAADHKNDWTTIRNHVISSAYDKYPSASRFASLARKANTGWLKTCYIGHDDPSLSQRFQVESLDITDPNRVVNLLYQTLGKAVCDTEDTSNPNPHILDKFTTVPPTEVTKAPTTKTAPRATSILRFTPSSDKPTPTLTILKTETQTPAPPKTTLPTSHTSTPSTATSSASATKITAASPTTTTTTTTTGGTTSDARSAMFATAGAGVGIITGGTLWVRYHIKKSQSRLQSNEENDAADKEDMEDADANRKTVVEITQEDVEVA